MESLGFCVWGFGVLGLGIWVWGFGVLGSGSSEFGVLGSRTTKSGLEYGDWVCKLWAVWGFVGPRGLSRVSIVVPFLGYPILWLGSYNTVFGLPRKGTTMETLGDYR